MRAPPDLSGLERGGNAVARGPVRKPVVRTRGLDRRETSREVRDGVYGSRARYTTEILHDLAMHFTLNN